MGALKASQVILLMITSVILARTLGVKDYGSYTYLLSIAGLIGIPAYAGVFPLLTREVAIYDHKQRPDLLLGIYDTARRYSIFMATLVLAGLGLVMISELRPTAPEFSLLPFLALALVPLGALCRVRSGLLQGMRRVVQAELPGNLLCPLVMVALISALALSDKLTLGSALGSQVLAIGIGFFLLGAFLRNALPEHTGAVQFERARWVRSFLPFVAIAATDNLNREFFVPLVGMMASPEEVAYFRIAFSLATLIQMPLSIVETVLRPHVARLYAEGDHPRLTRLVLKGGIAALLLSAPASLMLLIFGKHILAFAYGADYLPAFAALIPLVAGLSVINLIGPSTQLLDATAFEKDALVISAGTLVMIAVLGWTLIPEHGAVGAAYTFAIAKVARATTFRAWANVRLNRSFAMS